MAAQQRWQQAASEVLGAPVTEVIPLARRRPGAVGYWIAGIVVFAVAIFLRQAGVVPVPGLVMTFLGAGALGFLVQLGSDVVFAASTAAGVQMTGGHRTLFSATPTGPALGPLDSSVVSGPSGMFRNVFEIGGVKHRTSAWQRGRFQELLGQASR